MSDTYLIWYCPRCKREHSRVLRPACKEPWPKEVLTVTQQEPLPGVDQWVGETAIAPVLTTKIELVPTDLSCEGVNEWA